MEENTQSFERGSPSYIARKIRELYKVFGEDIEKSQWHFALNRYLRWFEEGGVEELIKSIKLTMLLLGNPSLYSSDNNRTPMDSLISLETGQYYRTNISSTDLQIIL